MTLRKLLPGSVKITLVKSQALIVWGGWEGHEPEPVAQLFKDILKAEQFDVELSKGTENFLNLSRLPNLKLIVPVITMSSIEQDQLDSVCAVVRAGVGIAGCHGGMCDSFREATEWQFMTGGQWVAHPGDTGVNYRIQIVDKAHPITAGLEDFDVQSEQYYLHIDPGIHVLAETEFPHPQHGGPHEGNPCRMPQIWTKRYGLGRVFYNAVGHSRRDLEESSTKELMRRGFLWAAGLMN